MSRASSSRVRPSRTSRTLSTRSPLTSARLLSEPRSSLTLPLTVVRSSTASSPTTVPRPLTRLGIRSSRVRVSPILRSGASVRTGKASRSLSRIPTSVTRISSSAFSPCTATPLSVRARSRTCLLSIQSLRTTSFLSSVAPVSSPTSSSRTTPPMSFLR